MKRPKQFDAFGGRGEWIAGVRVARFTVTALVGTLLFCGLVEPLRPLHADVTAEDVRAAIRQAVEYLKSQQNQRTGTWPDDSAFRGGVTPLVTLALLHAGEPADSPTIQAALQHLRQFKPNDTYTRSLQTMVFCLAEPQRDRLLIRENVEWLRNAARVYQTPQGEAVAWRYLPKPAGYDNSNTQFAILALMEAERVGVVLPDTFWEAVANHFRVTQSRDGGWGYTTGHYSTGSMTTAGIASLVIATGKTGRARARVRGGRVQCCGAEDENDDWVRIERGLDWLGRRFSVRFNPQSTGNILYYLYGLERVGRLTGQRFIGAHDWYREGADYLIQMQRRGLGGQWRGVGVGEDKPVIGTSLALLFLSKGRRPIVVAKLEYGRRDDWDYHSAGIPKLVDHVEQSWHQPLGWQSVDWAAATVEHLLESPVLFLSGADDLPVGREEKKKLKAYIQQGGFLFAEAREGNGCNARIFDRKFRALMAELFPDSPLRLLPPDHPIWYADGKVDPEFLRPLLGVDACCRISIVYSPRNLSCFWELSDRRTLARVPDAVRREIEACVQIGQNVLAYATNRRLKEKLERTHLPERQVELPPTDRGVLAIAKLMHEGGGDDAPQALPNLLAFVAGELGLRVRIENRTVEPTNKKLYEYPLLYIQGRFDFQWNEKEQAAIRRFLDNGGVLFGDAICSSPQFNRAFHREISKIFPDDPWERIPVTDPIFQDDDGGFQLDRVTLNDPRRGGGIGSRQVRIEPLLEGIRRDGRWVVIFSPYDLSCALQNANSPDCKGYISEDAYRIGLNVLLHVLRN